jgi:hypothetical protein
MSKENQPDRKEKLLLVSRWEGIFKNLSILIVVIVGGVLLFRFTGLSGVVALVVGYLTFRYLKRRMVTMYAIPIAVIAAAILLVLITVIVILVG